MQKGKDKEFPLGNDLLVQIDAQSWSFGQHKMAVYNFGTVDHGVTNPRLDHVVKRFQYLEIWRACRHVKRCHSSNRRTGIVRSDRHVAGLSHRGDLSRFGNAAGVANVRLDYIDRSFANEIEVKVPREKPLSGRDRNTQMGNGGAVKLN